MVNNSLLNEHQAAELLGIKMRTLANWRRRGRGPAYVKLHQQIRYRPGDLATFVAQRVMHPLTHPDAAHVVGEA